MRELDRWVVALLQEKTRQVPAGEITSTDLAEMISGYVLFHVADDPAACWSACDIDGVSDAEIMAATSFTEDLLAAAFVGAVYELGEWQDRAGIAFMIRHGVAPEDAAAVAQALNVVADKLSERGQALIQHLTHCETHAIAF